jgi:hypothetical protein
MSLATFPSPTMSSSSSLNSAAPTGAAHANSFLTRLSALYGLSPENQYVFGSPLGPFPYRGQPVYLPRFAFFGPNASDESWRLAFLAGFDHRDLRPSQALLALIEHLGKNTDQGQGLNLTFFPLVDATGLAHGVSRALHEAHWGWSPEPEIDVLEKDARLHGYHGFIRVETAAAGDDEITVRVREPLSVIDSPDVEIISSEETTPFPVRFERAVPGLALTDGPLTIADDLPVQPFELTLRIPASWSDEDYSAAVSAILLRFLHRYRAFQAYGQSL